MLRTILLLLCIVNIAYGQELITITPEQFIAENPSIERKIITDFIIHQFDSKHEQEVSQAKIDQLWYNDEARKAFKMARFQVIDQKLYAESFYPAHLFFTSLIEGLQRVISKYKIRDVDFIIYLCEELQVTDEIADIVLKLPAFMMSKNLDAIHEKDTLLFPDAFIMRNDWSSILNKINQADALNPWQKKINKIFWRGATSGWIKDKPYEFGRYNLENFDKLPRLSLVILSRLYPNVIDAEFTGYPDFMDGNKSSDELKYIIRTLSPIEVTRTDEADHLKYKYLISIDGNTCSWLRVPWIMFSNSALIKQETNYLEWFYPAMKPYVHYVPVNERLTDIFTQIQWLKTHDDELKRIAFNAHKFVEENLTQDQIDAQVALILNAYHSLQKDTQIKPSIAPAEDNLSLYSLIKYLLYRFKVRIMNLVEVWS